MVVISKKGISTSSKFLSEIIASKQPLSLEHMSFLIMPAKTGIFFAYKQAAKATVNR